MIRKLVRTMLTAQIFSALTVSLCLLIDSIIIGRFYHDEGMAAYSYANPILLAIGALGTLLSAGVQVTCSKSLARGSQEETNAGYSSAVALSMGISLLFTAGVILFRGFLAQALGAGGNAAVRRYTEDYLFGFSIGAPASMAALVLVPFLQMAGQSDLLIVSVLTMTLTDVGLDLVNALWLKWGMFGMGLASSVSYYAAVLIALGYFLSRKCVFRFSPAGVSGRKMAELFRGGLPAGFTMAASVLLVYILNRILRRTDDAFHAVAAFSVISAIGNASCCITTGIGGVSLTLSGIFYNEEDRASLRETMRLLMRSGVFLGLAVGAALLIAAPAAVSLFIPEAGETRDLAVLGLRLFAAGLIPCCLNNALKSMYQGTGRVGLTELISVIEGTVFPALAAFVFSRFMDAEGVWLYFAAGEVLTLIGIGLLVRLRSGKHLWQGDAPLMLKDGFGVTDEDLLEARLGTMAEVEDTAARAGDFCRERGGSPRLANHISLCVEELAGNVIRHGFADGKPHHMSVRLLRKPDTWILRLRDDCRAFDPVHYVPAGGEGEPLGIHLALALADEAAYTYSLNLNNLTLKFPASDASDPSI